MAAERIEVIGDPGGDDLPLEVRLAWIGCKMQVHENFNDCGHVPYWSMGALSGKSLKGDGFDVAQAEALRALRELGTITALFALKWWQDRKFPQEGKCFRFPSRSVRVLETRELKRGGKIGRFDDLDYSSIS